MDDDAYGPRWPVSSPSHLRSYQTTLKGGNIQSSATIIHLGQTKEEAVSISVKFNFRQRTISLCLGKNMRVWQNVKNWDFVSAGGSSWPGIHRSCRRPGVWRRELETWATSRRRGDEPRLLYKIFLNLSGLWTLSFPFPSIEPSTSCILINNLHKLCLFHW